MTDRPNVFDRDVTLTVTEIVVLIRLVTDQLCALVESEPEAEEAKIARRTLLDTYDSMLAKLVAAHES